MGRYPSHSISWYNFDTKTEQKRVREVLISLTNRNEKQNLKLKKMYKSNPSVETHKNNHHDQVYPGIQG